MSAQGGHTDVCEFLLQREAEIDSLSDVLSYIAIDSLIHFMMVYF